MGARRARGVPPRRPWPTHRRHRASVRCHPRL